MDLMMGPDENQDLFPHSDDLQPLPSPELQSQFEFKGGVGSESLMGVPKPLEALHEAPIPPFLSKTYDLVDDPSLDAIISWGERGDSFVVCDPVEFARLILPRNFKHNNFSSFVRQLNTYGFRKINTEKWEFTNGGFLKGQRHLLKRIQRRKSAHCQQVGGFSGSSNEAGKPGLEGEIERLKQDRRLIMQEVVDLQHEQRGTVHRMEVVKEKLEAAEKRQKGTVSFLAKMLQKPAVLACLQQAREKKSISDPRTKRRLVEHQANEPGSSQKGHISFRPDSDMRDSPAVCGAGQVPSQVDQLVMADQLLHVPEQVELVPTLGTMDSVVEAKCAMSPQPQPRNECLVSFPEDLVVEKTGPQDELSAAGSGSMGMEDVWGNGLEAGAGMSGSWGDLINYDVQGLGISNAISDTWDIGIEKWLDEDSL